MDKSNKHMQSARITNQETKTIHIGRAPSGCIFAQNRGGVEMTVGQLSGQRGMSVVGERGPVGEGK